MQGRLSGRTDLNQPHTRFAHTSPPHQPPARQQSCPFMHAPPTLKSITRSQYMFCCTMRSMSLAAWPDSGARLTPPSCSIAQGRKKALFANLWAGARRLHQHKPGCTIPTKHWLHWQCTAA